MSRLRIGDEVLVLDLDVVGVVVELQRRSAVVEVTSRYAAVGRRIERPRAQLERT